jgi:hypothetical protein
MFKECSGIFGSRPIVPHREVGLPRINERPRASDALPKDVMVALVRGVPAGAGITLEGFYDRLEAEPRLRPVPSQA